MTPMTPVPRVPTVHLNGDTQETLLRQVTDAMEALYVAIEAMYRAGPNGRNFYPQGPQAFRLAAEEHEKRIAVVRGVRDELAVIAEAIADGGQR